MISGNGLIKVKLDNNNADINISIDQLYSICGDKNVKVFNKGNFIEGSFKEHFLPNAELFRVNTGSSYIDVTGNTEIQTSKGIKKISDLRMNDLIACYEEDEDFSNNGISYKSIYSIVPIKNEGYPLFSCSSEFTLENNIIIAGE